MGKTPEDRSVFDVLRVEAGSTRRLEDTLAVEAALEIHVAGTEPVITMRTPGADPELAVGLMFGEGVIRSRDDIADLVQTDDQPDMIRLLLKPSARRRLPLAERSELVSSACGICGKPRFSLGVLRDRPAARPGPTVDLATLMALPRQLRDTQGVFRDTGGLHAAALFDAGGRLLATREDVGRHNALDKLVGWAVLDGRVPLERCLLLLSGRASYELLQKSIMAGIPLVCAISAPSSFAADLAADWHTTLVGFLRPPRCNIYAAPERLRIHSGDSPSSSGEAVGG